MGFLTDGSRAFRGCFDFTGRIAGRGSRRELRVIEVESSRNARFRGTGFTSCYSRCNIRRRFSTPVAPRRGKVIREGGETLIRVNEMVLGSTRLTRSF